VALAVAAPALVAAAGALLLLDWQFRVGRQRHSDRIPAALTQFVRATERGENA
jgi:Flp pilus assembly protein TadB